MTLQLSTTVRNNMLGQTIYDGNLNNGGGAADPWMFIMSGTVPASPAAARTGTKLASFAIPSWGTPASGAVALNSSPQTLSADGTGTATYFYIGPADGTVALIQGTVGTSGTDLIVDSTSFLTGQAFSLLSFNMTEGNA